MNWRRLLSAALVVAASATPMLPAASRAQPSPATAMATATATRSPGTAPRPELGQVDTLAALEALPAGLYSTVYRAGFLSHGDGGGAFYNYSPAACSMHSGAGDDGAQVAAHAGGCWTLQPGAMTDIRVWGAKADDATDVGRFIQAAYSANVGCISVPAGTWRWSSAVTIAAQSPCVRGAGWNEAVQSGSRTGTWIHITSTSLVPVTISGVTGQGGTGGFEDLAFIEDQPAPAAGWSPAAYQPVFKLMKNLGRVDFHDLMFYNTTHCIEAHQAARMHITSIYGQPLGTCLQIDQARDVFQISSVEFWPFWSGDSNVAAYQQANVDPILLLRADSPTIDDVFTFSYHSTIAFGTSTELIPGDAGAVTTGAQFGSIESDAAKYGLWIKPGTGGVQFQVANLRGAGETFPGTGPIPGSETYRDDGAGTAASIANLDCFYAGASCVHLTGSGSLQIANAVLWNFNVDNTGAAGMDAGAHGYLTLANQPNVANLQHGGPVIPAFSAGGVYAVRGTRQYWTPTVQGTTTAGRVTYTSQAGTFWYDGSQLTLVFNIAASASRGMTGSVAITGLPMKVNGASAQPMYCSLASHSGVTADTNYSSLSGRIDPAGAQQILLLESGGRQSTVALPASSIRGGFSLQGSCTLSAGQ